MAESLKIAQELYNKLSELYNPQKCTQHEYYFKDRICKQCVLIDIPDLYCEKCLEKHRASGCQQQLVSVRQWLSSIRENINNQVNSARRVLDQCLNISIRNIKCQLKPVNQQDGIHRQKIALINSVILTKVCQYLKQTNKEVLISHLESLKIIKLKDVFHRYGVSILNKISQISEDPVDLFKLIGQIVFETQTVKRQIRENFKEIQTSIKQLFKQKSQQTLQYILATYFNNKENINRLSVLQNQQLLFEAQILKNKCILIEKQYNLLEHYNKQQLQEISKMNKQKSALLKTIKKLQYNQMIIKNQNQRNIEKFYELIKQEQFLKKQLKERIQGQTQLQQILLKLAKLQSRNQQFEQSQKNNLLIINSLKVQIQCLKKEVDISQKQKQEMMIKLQTLTEKEKQIQSLKQEIYFQKQTNFRISKQIQENKNQMKLLIFNNTNLKEQLELAMRNLDSQINQKADKSFNPENQIQDSLSDSTKSYDASDLRKKHPRLGSPFSHQVKLKQILLGSPKQGKKLAKRNIKEMQKKLR